MDFGKKPSTADKMKTVEKRLGTTTGASKGKAPLPKGKISLKGTNPLKEKAAITWKKKL